MSGELDWLSDVATALWSVFNSFFQSVFDPTTPGSIILALWNFLPIVGANPMSNETAVMLTMSIGVIVAWFKWFR